MHISNAGPHQPTAASFFNLEHQIKYVCMYRQRLEERRKQEEAEKNAKARKETEAQKQLAEEKAFQEKKRKLKQTEKDLQKEHEEHQFKLKAAEVLLSEANQRLADAVKSKDFNEVTVSQGLLEIAHKKDEDCTR